VLVALLLPLLRRFVTYPSPLVFPFFLPNFQNSQLCRPFVKQHMKAPSWFSAALRTPLSVATRISFIGMRALEAVRASTLTSSSTFRYIPLALIFPNLTVLLYLRNPPASPLSRT